MTITVTSIDQGPFTATGLAQTVAYTFMTLTDDEISVYYVASGAGRVLVDPALHTVTRNKNIDGSAKEGGSVELLESAAPAGSLIYLRANPRADRDLVWSDTGSRLKNLNEEQDRITLRQLIFYDVMARAVVVDPGQPVPSPQDVINAAYAIADRARIDFSNVTPSVGRSGLGLSYASQLEAETGTSDARSMTPLKALQASRVLVDHLNIREKRFAGGAKLNGIDDDAPAIRAALAFAKTQGQGFYGGASPELRIPWGRPRLDTVDPAATDRVLNLTDAQNITISGAGDGSSTLKSSVNAPVFKSSDALANPLFRTTLKDFAIEGPGAASVNAHGIDLGPNNNCLIQSVRVFACRRGLAYENAFHTRFIDVNMNGTGGLANYDGLYSKDGAAGVVENAVLIVGGQIQGCQRYGWRGESVTGTKVFGLEVLGCGSIGVYFGDSPLGKDLKWFTWAGGLIDTCPDLLVVSKGSSTVAQMMHWSGMWMGYASEGGGNGKGVDLRGLIDCTFRADMLVNVDRAVELLNCARVTVDIGTIADYDRSLVGDVAILLQNTTRSTVRIGTTKKTATSPSTVAFVEGGTSNYNLVTGNFDGAVNTIGAQSNKVGALV